MYRSWNHGVDQLKLPLIKEWEHFHQVLFDEMIRQWCTRLQAGIQAHKGHFEQTLVAFDICTDVHFDSHVSLWVPIVDTFVLG